MQHLSHACRRFQAIKAREKAVAAKCSALKVETDRLLAGNPDLPVWQAREVAKSRVRRGLV